MNRSPHRVLVATALAALVALPAWAQTVPQKPTRPYQGGVFGGNQQAPQSGQSLTVTFLGEGNYDDNVAANLGGVGVNPDYEGGGYGLAGLAVLDYRRGREEHNYFSAAAQSGVRTYDDNNRNDDLRIVHHAGSADFEKELGRHTIIGASGRASYEPYYTLRAYPVFGPPETGLPPLAGVDYAINTQKTMRYNTRARLRQDVGRRSLAFFEYGFDYTDFLEDDSEFRDFSYHTARVLFSHQVSARTDLNATYGYQLGDQGYTTALADSQFESHTAEVGLTHRRRLSPSREMSFGISGGATRTYSPGQDGERQSYTDGTGSARFSIDLARSWGLWSDYRRGVRFMVGFTQPFYYDRATVNVGGYVSPKWFVSAGGGYDGGQVSFSGARNYNTWFGQAQVQYAIARYTAITGTYFYYQYEYDDTVVLPEGVPQTFDRQAVRLSVVFWLPVIR